MKKLLSILLMAALAISVGATSAFAATAPRGVNFLDANNDGICDIRSGRDADGNGICDNCPGGGVCAKDGTGRRGGCKGTNRTGFVDANGDGVCDNNTNGRTCPVNGTGVRRGRNQ